MAINPNLLNIKQAKDLPVADPTSNADFLFYEDNALKKAPMSNIYDKVISGVKGIATQANAPTPDADFERWIVSSPITAPNSWGNLTVTQAELDENFVYFNVTNGVVSKELSSKKVTFNQIKKIIGSRDLNAGGDGSGVLGSVINEENLINSSINGLSGRFPNVGNLILLILNNKRPYVDAPEYTYFDVVREINLEISNIGEQTIDLSYLDINLQEGDYIGFGKNSTSLPYYSNSVGIGRFTTSFDFSGAGYFIGLYIPNSGFDIEFLSEKSLFVKTSDKTRITVTRNPENYNSIRAKIEELKEFATAENQFEIFVPNGEWFESDIFETGDFIEIVGEDCLNTILYCDGNSTKITPANYSFSDQANKQLNAVPAIYKHVVNARGNIRIKNITIKANDGKYCAHLDSLNYEFCDFKNVRFIDVGNLSNTVGIGLNGGQNLKFHECEFTIENVSEKWKSGVFFHNWNNQSRSCKLEIHNSFFNCNYLTLDELGSEQRDVVELLNCDTSGSSEITVMVDSMGSSTFWTNEDNIKETDPLKVPYCIFFNSTGTKIEHIYAKPYGAVTNPRPLMAQYIRGKYSNIF